MQLRARPTLRVLGLVLALLVVASAAALWIRHRLGQTIKAQVRSVVEGTLQASATSLQSMLVAAKRHLITVVTYPPLALSAEECMQRGVRCEGIQQVLHGYAGVEGQAHVRFADLQGAVRFSAPDEEATGSLTAVALAKAERLSRGQTTIVDAVWDGGRPVLRMVARVFGPAGKPVGIVLVDLPIDPISAVMQATRVGYSGETYLFDGEGRMLTDSRFVAQLERVGLIEKGHGTALSLTLRDPGVNLIAGEVPKVPRSAQPLTRMAAHAVAGKSGADVDGYRDYRGVPVVGAWRFMPEFGLGIATEIDVDEAFRALFTLQRMFLILFTALTVALLGSLLVMLFNAGLRKRVADAERRAERFGQYQLERKLGEGGMGVVYLASHALLRRKAAIKLLRPDRVSAESVARFEHEVQITSTLTHPNTVEVYDYGRTDGGDFYYVMEYLVGLDLQRLVLQFGPLPQARAIHFLRQLCGSLAEAHAAGVVHRDIKPANLFACKRGGVVDTLKVLDFGIVQSGRGGTTVQDQQGGVIGTAEYMAPELFEAPNDATAQSDLYAVGIVAYFLLTGAAPFSGENTREVCMSHLPRTPEAIVLPDDEALDPVLETVIAACLAKQPSARPASALHLSTLLERSPRFRAWTQRDAQAWWCEHDEALGALFAGEPVDTRRSLTVRLGA